MQQEMQREIDIFNSISFQQFEDFYNEMFQKYTSNDEKEHILREFRRFIDLLEYTREKKAAKLKANPKYGTLTLILRNPNDTKFKVTKNVDVAVEK